MNLLQRLRNEIKGYTGSEWMFNGTGKEDDGVTLNPYKKSDLVYICISKTARAISQAPLIVQTQNVKGIWEPSPNDPWNSVLKRPNLYMDMYSFVEALVGFLLLDGNVWTLGFPLGVAVPDSLWVLSKKSMSKKLDSKTGHLEYWSYDPKQSEGTTETDSGSEVPIYPEEVAHVKFWNPDDPIMGQRPLEAGSLPLRSDYKAARYNETFFDEGAVPGGVLSTDKKLTDPSFHRAKAEFQARHAGYSKGHRIAVLDMGLKYETKGLSQKDMEYLDLRRYSRETILQIFGMNKAVLGITEGLNRATSTTQQTEWWKGTNVPLMRLISESMNFIFFPDGRKRVVFDTSNVDALHEEFSDKVKTGEQLFKMGFTRNEINERLEFGFEEKKWGNYWYVSGTARRVLDDGTIEEPVRPTEVPKQPSLLLESEEGFIRGQIEYTSVVSESWIRQVEEVWKGLIERVVEPLEEVFESKTKALFFNMRKKILSTLYKGIDDLDRGVDFHEERAWFKSQSRKLYERALKDGGDSVISELSMGGVFDLNDPIALSFLMEKPLKVVGIVDTVAKQLRLAIQTGAEQGESINQIADRIRQVFNASKARATTIARTEMLSSVNYGRSIQMQRSTFQNRLWFTAGDDRVRPTHAEMQGQSMPMGEPWVLSSGVSLRFPGDYNGPPNEIINCRCIEVVDMQSKV